MFDMVQYVFMVVFGGAALVVAGGALGVAFDGHYMKAASYGMVALALVWVTAEISRFKEKDE